MDAKTCYPKKNTPCDNTVQNLLNALTNILVKWHRVIILKTAGIVTITYQFIGRPINMTDIFYCYVYRYSMSQ